MSDSSKPHEDNFIAETIKNDLQSGRYDYVRTRFAPEPNAYIHVGHAISMSATYDVAEAFGAEYNLRIDDTNPATEREEYVRAILEDIRWLGYRCREPECYATDYFDLLYRWAVQLINADKAYVCDLSEDEIRDYRGTSSYDNGGRRRTPPGRESPFRERSAAENLDLFERMKNGEFPDGLRTLRAKIDMSHDNHIMRDPVMYRILHVRHFRIGDTWCIYPTYDWAHGQSDSIEGITHSICAIEFRHHRPLYNWFLDQLDIHHPRQVEHTRVNITHTVTSKRYLLPLIENNLVSGWDDPRMPTLRGMRRRGYPPEAIREFCRRLSLSELKPVATVDVKFFEHCVREYLNRTAPRTMGVLRPVKLVLTNYPDDMDEEFAVPINPEDPAAGTKTIHFSRELLIEREDFMEEPPAKFYRLAPGREVRLRYAYLVTCEEVIKDKNGHINELRCSYDPATKGGDAPDGRRVKATLHWVSAKHSVSCKVRLFDHLMKEERPEVGGVDTDWQALISPESLKVLADCRVEPELATMETGYRFQFERLGYFCIDTDSCAERPVINRILPLRDSWKRLQKKL